MLFTFAPGDRAMAMPKGVALAVTSRYLLLQVRYIVSPAGAERHPAAAPVTPHPVPTTLELKSTSAQASSAPPLELAHFFELGPRFHVDMRALVPARGPQSVARPRPVCHLRDPTPHAPPRSFDEDGEGAA